MHLMRIVHPTHLLAVLVGSCLVGCVAATLGDRRIDWNPPNVDGERMEVRYSDGPSSGSIRAAPDHVSLASLAPGTYRIALHRLRSSPLSEDTHYLPPGLVSFDWSFDLAIE